LLLSFVSGLWRLESIVVVRGMTAEEASKVGIERPDWWAKHHKRVGRIFYMLIGFKKYSLIFGLLAYASFHIINFLNKS
jgi:hypothetical protein